MQILSEVNNVPEPANLVGRNNLTNTYLTENMLINFSQGIKHEYIHFIFIDSKSTFILFLALLLTEYFLKINSILGTLSLKGEGSRTCGCLSLPLF